MEFNISEDTIVRFFNKVDKRGEDECWNWLGAKKPSGYGNAYLDNSYITSHRLAWIIYNGSVPNGLSVLHRCDNKSCCNPKHLYLGTQSDNIRDYIKKYPTPVELTAHPKLYTGEVWLIRRLKIVTGYTLKGLEYKFSSRFVAKMFKVSAQTILKIWEGNKPFLCKGGRFYDFSTES